MGDFDFGAFKELFEYLAGKLSEGGALTPEEQKAYDGLMAIANQGLNLTETADFKSLYTAFNTLADSETKKKFEELYGTGLIEDPATGAVAFTRPGTLVAAMMRRGLSVNDGPVQALLSEGLRNFMDTTAKNSFAAMTNSYQAMTPIRGQNIAAFQGAGNIGSTAIGRRGLVAGSAIGGGRAGAGEGAGEGVGAEGLKLPPPPTSEAPTAWDKIWPMLLGIVGTGGMAALTPYLAGLLKKDGKEPEAPEERGGSRWWDPEKPAIPQEDAAYGETAGWAGGQATPYNPYEVSQQAFQAAPDQPQYNQYNPYEVNQSAFQAQPDQWNSQDDWMQVPSYQYDGQGSAYGSDWGNQQQPYDYQDWSQPQQNYDYSFQDYADYGQDYNTNYGQSYDDSWAQDYDYSYSGGGDSWDVPSSDDWYSENW